MRGALRREGAAQRHDDAGSLQPRTRLCTCSPRRRRSRGITSARNIHLQRLTSAGSESTSIPKNPRTDRPVGYAFVDLSTPSEAERAIAELSGKEILDRKVSVQLARKPEPTQEKVEGGASGGEGVSGGEGGRRRASGRGRGRGRGRGGRANRNVSFPICGRC